MSEEPILPNEELVRPIAASFARSYRMIERDDIAQELRLWWIANPKVVTRYAEDEHGERKMTKALKRVADRFCRQEKARMAGYSVDDEYFYNTELVRELLPLVWSIEDLTQDQRPDAREGKVRSTKPPNEGNNLLAMVCDVSMGLDKIDPAEADLLWQHYGLNEDYSELAKAYEVSKDAIKMRVHRAVEHIVEVLGGDNPWNQGPGTRRVMSNAQAQSATSHMESGQ